MNFIFGAGGFAREVDWLIRKIYSESGVDYRPNFYVCSDSDSMAGTSIKGVSVISETEYFNKYSNAQNNCFISVGRPGLKKLMHKKLLEKSRDVNFPALIYPNVCLDPDGVKIGQGSIICAGTILTTDIILSDFVHLNIDSTVGHDVRIGCYSTISPGVHISGRVNLGDGSFIGTGAVVLESINVERDVIIGAGAVVVKDLNEIGTYVGAPAKRIK